MRRVLPVYAVLVGCGTDLPMRRVRERVVAAGHAAVSYTDVQWVRAYVWARFWDFGVRGEEEERERLPGSAISRPVVLPMPPILTK